MKKFLRIIIVAVGTVGAIVAVRQVVQDLSDREELWHSVQDSTE